MKSFAGVLAALLLGSGYAQAQEIGDQPAGAFVGSGRDTPASSGATSTAATATVSSGGPAGSTGTSE
jgi:hypothetical protein